MLRRHLAGIGAVLIEGVKWCGKTTTAAQQAATILYMNDPKQLRQNLRMADINSSMLLEGTVPLLIDKWQTTSKLWDAVRLDANRRGMPGQFILTGSAVPPPTDDIRHTGTGRFAYRDTDGIYIVPAGCLKD